MFTAVPFIKYQIVFAKCPNYPPWPAQIIQLFIGVSNTEEQKIMYKVKFFASPTTSVHKETELEKFNDLTIEKYQKMYLGTSNKDQLQVLKAIKSALGKQSKSQQMMKKFMEYHGKPPQLENQPQQVVEKKQQVGPANIKKNRIERIRRKLKIAREQKKKRNMQMKKGLHFQQLSMDEEDPALSKEKHFLFPNINFMISSEFKYLYQKEKKEIEKGVDQSKFQPQNINLNKLIQFNESSFDPYYDEYQVEEENYVEMVRGMRCLSKGFIESENYDVLQEPIEMQTKITRDLIEKMKQHVRSSHPCIPLSMKEKRILMTILVNKENNRGCQIFEKIISEAATFILHYELTPSPNKKHYQNQFQLLFGKIRMHFIRRTFPDPKDQPSSKDGDSSMKN